MNGTSLPERLRAMRMHSRRSMPYMAKKLGYKTPSGYQRYEDPTLYKKTYLPHELMPGLLSAFVDRGEPPITKEDVLGLFGVNSIETRMTKVIGYIGAGAEVYPFGDSNDTFDEVPTPPWLAGAIGLIVRGESMWPRFEDGMVVLVEDRDFSPESLYGETCYVRLTDGRAFLKVLAKGTRRGLYTLRSHNAPDIEDVVIDRVYPIAFIVPARARGRMRN